MRRTPTTHSNVTNTLTTHQQQTHNTTPTNDNTQGRSTRNRATAQPRNTDTNALTPRHSKRPTSKRNNNRSYDTSRVVSIADGHRW